MLHIKIAFLLLVLFALGKCGKKKRHGKHSRSKRQYNFSSEDSGAGSESSLPSSLLDLSFSSSSSSYERMDGDRRPSSTKRRHPAQSPSGSMATKYKGKTASLKSTRGTEQRPKSRNLTHRQSLQIEKGKERRTLPEVLSEVTVRSKWKIEDSGQDHCLILPSFAGIINEGNSCYASSTLQLLFNINPLLQVHHNLVRYY